MRKLLIILSVVFLVGVVLFSGCKKQKKELTLAKIGNRIITLSDFEQRYRPREYKSTEEEKTEKMKILNRMIEDKLFAVAGEKEGLTKDVDENLKDYPDRLAVNQLYQEVVVKKAKVPFYEVRKTYKKMGKELHGRHILCKTKEEADNIYKKLIKNNGSNFAELAKSSADSRTREKGGDMGWFSWGRMDPDHQKVAYKLKKGQISKPFKTRFGWDILQIVDEREKKLKPFDEEKENITKSLKSEKMSKLANDYIERLKKNARIKYNSSTISLLIQKTPNTNQQNPFQASPLPVLTADESKKVIATSILGKMTAGDLLAKAAKGFRRPPLNSVDAIKRYIESTLINELLIKQAKRMHLDKSPEVMKNYNEARDSRIASEYRKKHIVPRENIPEDELKTYYKEHRDKFKIDEKRETRIVVLKTKAEADDIYKKIKKGGNIETLAKQKSTHYTGKKGGKFGPFSLKRFPKGYGQVAFSLKKGEVSEPFKTKDGYVVMKVTKIIPATYYTFDKVKNRIINEIKNQDREKIKNELIEKLKKEIPVTINEDVLLEAGKEQNKGEKK